MFWQKFLFIILIFVCLTPFVSPPIALVLGLIFALVAEHPYPKGTSRATKILLQVSVVLLGFGMNLDKVLEAGRSGILFTVATIFGTLAFGFLIGKLLNVNPKTSALISSGTAICGGSAIAAVAPAIDAETDEISVSLGTIFILNSVALLTFPFVGKFFNLTQNQFGVWAAIAIHDTSSVVGASQAFGAEALAVATTVKLARALWIAPVALLFSFLFRGQAAKKIVFPYFILFFLLATIFRTYAPTFILPSVYDSIVLLAKQGLTVTLFLIGSGLSFETLKKVGYKPLMQGVILWILISIVSLWAILSSIS